MSRLVIDEKFACWTGEYASILKAAKREGWLLPLLDAHWTPCDQDDAIRLLAWIRVYQIEGGLPDNLDLRWRNKRGRARFSVRTRRYGISLPLTPGTNYAHLRAGLVLHEAAHVIDRVQSGTFGHKEKFRRILRRLVEDNWRKNNVRTGNQREIYDRHRGPYSLLLGRAIPGKGGKVKEDSDRISGPMSAEEAHEEARILVNDTKDTIMNVHVFSDSEGQFIGAFYKRGEKYPAWSEMMLVPDLDATEEMDAPGQETNVDVDRSEERGLDVSTERDETALLPGGPEPLQQMAPPVNKRMPIAAVPKRRPVRNVPPQEQAAAGTQRKRGSLLGIAADKIDKWPASKGASIVRTALIELGQTGISAADLAKRLAAELAAAGVEFPASLISRLKQGGFIKEVQD